jgi:carboxypeptidase C (cathepsin A)
MYYLNRKIFYNDFILARDLVELTKGFFDAVPKFRSVPLYIYGISYGGKMATDFSLLLYKVSITFQYV